MLKSQSRFRRRPCKHLQPHLPGTFLHNLQLQFPGTLLHNLQLQFPRTLLHNLQLQFPCTLLHNHQLQFPGMFLHNLQLQFPCTLLHNLQLQFPGTLLHNLLQPRSISQSLWNQEGRCKKEMSEKRAVLADGSCSSQCLNISSHIKPSGANHSMGGGGGGSRKCTNLQSAQDLNRPVEAAKSPRSAMPGVSPAKTEGSSQPYQQ